MQAIEFAYMSKFLESATNPKYNVLLCLPHDGFTQFMLLYNQNNVIRKINIYKRTKRRNI